ncbi:hypothetical protein VT84_18995 [Gemmata sp. SH-PL17]|nr:hypothetical protein VT84_18995 [Gemmata sp. SH-PL17]
MGKKKLTKPTKQNKQLTPLLAAGQSPGGVAAAPHIINPFANSFVPPGVDLTVNITTNRGDLRYKVTFTDLTPPPPAPPAPLTTNIPANGGAGFTLVIPGANLQTNRVYEIFVFVDPADGASPPHLDHTINVHTTPPAGFTMVTAGTPAE